MPYEKRTSGAQLPSAEELFDILAKESPRHAIKYDFIDKNKHIFKVHKKVSLLAHSNDDWIESYREVELPRLVDMINKNHDEVSTYITTHSDKSEIFGELYEALVPEQDTTPSEALFVFGAPSNSRIERAIELYRQGVSKMIIISGHGPHYGNNQVSEALRMAEAAQKAGIPATSLIVEDKAVTIPDNAKRTIDLLMSLNWKLRSITLIATDFVLSRAQMDWYKFTPWDIEIKVVAARSRSPHFTKEGWYKDKSTISLVLNEYAKLILESKMDLIRKGKH